MTLWGSAHYEWPPDYEKETEMELSKEHEEYLWEKELEQGPPPLTENEASLLNEALLFGHSIGQKYPYMVKQSIERRLAEFMAGFEVEEMP